MTVYDSGNVLTAEHRLMLKASMSARTVGKHTAPCQIKPRMQTWRPENVKTRIDRQAICQTLNIPTYIEALTQSDLFDKPIPVLTEWNALNMQKY